MRLPTYFISHGGGPWPWLDGPFRRQFEQLEASLQDIARKAGKPRAISASEVSSRSNWRRNGPSSQGHGPPPCEMK